MIVYMDGKPITLTAKQQLGMGGEGSVFAYQKQALKVYHQPTRQRADKLKAIIANPPNPRHGTVPLKLVTDDQQQIVGFLMDKIGVGYEDVGKLWDKQYNASHSPSTRTIARIFINAAKDVAGFHQAGYYVGDFNDENEQFIGESLLWLDIDAWQFGKFPCPVGKERWLDPMLYNLDLSLKPSYQPDNDWYSFAALFFNSILKMHIYGGTHKKVKLFTDRASQRITVFDANVTRPMAGLSPDLFSDDLLDIFHRIFVSGIRGTVPLDLLTQYESNLIDCANCGASFPRSRKSCPVCSAKHVIPNTTTNKGVTTRELMDFHDRVIFSKMVGDLLYVITADQTDATLHRWTENAPVKSNWIGGHVTGTRYEMAGERLVSNPPNSTRLEVGKEGLETQEFSGTNKAMFRSNGRYLFRIMAGQLLYGEYVIGTWIERSLRSVSEGQTWFTVRSDGNKVPTVCGFFQVFTSQHWWLSWEGRLYDNLQLTPLDTGDVQKGVLVRMDNHSAIIKRAVERKGVEWTYTSYVDEHGGVTNLTPIKSLISLPHGAIYQHGTLLYTTDEGVVAERNGTLNTFTQTKGLVQEGDTLYNQGNDLIVIQQDKVIYLKLN